MAIAAAITDQWIKIGVGGVADRPVVRRFPKGEDLASALNDFAWELDAQDDSHASAKYRRHLVRNIGKTLVKEAR